MTGAPLPTNEFDVAVIGGGVAGLWTAALLARDKFRVVVIEKAGLGDGQSGASQGILHGGVKYTLGGGGGGAAKAIAEMPGVWRACMEGRGPIALRNVRVLSEYQYLWTTESMLSKITAGVASKVIRTAVEQVKASAACEGLKGAPAGVTVYRVAEPVLDPASVTAALAASVERESGVIVYGEGKVDVKGRVVRVGEQIILAQRFVLAAGAGNEGLLAGMGYAEKLTQRRPLHIVMAKGRLPDLYGHCIAGMSDKPRLTVTSQKSGGETVWYIGGEIAESGVRRIRERQIDEAKKEVAACLPWVKLDGVQWATMRIDRAEGLMPGGARPDEPVIVGCGVRDESGHHTAVAVWPTKLVFAPLVAERVLARLKGEGVEPSYKLEPVLDSDNEPVIAPLPWEREGLLWT